MSVATRRTVLFTVRGLICPKLGRKEGNNNDHDNKHPTTGKKGVKGEYAWTVVEDVDPCVGMVKMSVSGFPT